MYRLALALPALCILAVPLVSQSQSPDPTAPKPSIYAAVPAEAAKAPNPVKSSPESLARAKKWWNLDCAMCHNANGNGKGETGQDMKLTMVDFTDPTTIKDRTDGEIFYIIKNGAQDMPAEGPRIKTQENWDLVNYVRSFAKKKDAAK